MYFYAAFLTAFTAWRRMGSNVRMNIYKCDKCKAWHLGKSSNPIRFAERIGQLLDNHKKKIGSKP